MSTGLTCGLEDEVHPALKDTRLPVSHGCVGGRAPFNFSLSRYRDKDQSEVDFVLEIPARQVVGMDSEGCSTGLAGKLHQASPRRIAAALVDRLRASTEWLAGYCI